MFKLNLINSPNFLFDEKIIDKIRKTINKKIEISQKGTLNIVFVDDEHIKELNKNYRQKDAVTDVLSFHYFDDFSGLKTNEIAGEIILNEGKIKSQAIEYGLGEDGEFYKLIIHSILHILGYDHEKDEDFEIMNKFENLIWKEIFEKNKKI
ncbi:MAG: rRNA maturation RNase YbeY [Candidatus Gracilibacteria bacterium]|nr:rRNA maturation RNase YbeY [Candidatus Gracilibacteria bacterium]